MAANAAHARVMQKGDESEDGHAEYPQRSKTDCGTSEAVKQGRSGLCIVGLHVNLLPRGIGHLKTACA